jgi:hypothetical protein
MKLHRVINYYSWLWHLHSYFFLLIQTVNLRFWSLPLMRTLLYCRRYCLVFGIDLAEISRQVVVALMKYLHERLKSFRTGAGGSSAPSPLQASSDTNGSGSSLHSTLALDLEVGKSVHEYLEECLEADVSVLDRDKFDAVPEYQKDQLIIAEHLGKGSYSDVFEVRLNVSIFEENSDSIDDIIKRLGVLSSAVGGPSPPVHQKNQDAANVTATARDDITAGRRHPRMTRRLSFTNSVHEQAVKRPNRCDERQVVYAMKCLRPQIRSDADQFIIGAEDLVHETALLATLNHPNIISLHGRAAGQ